MSEENKHVYSLEDTRIESAGVMRCCVHFVGAEYEGKSIFIGDKSKCHACGGEFILKSNTGKRPAWFTEKQWSMPVWKGTNEPDKS